MRTVHSGYFKDVGFRVKFKREAFDRLLETSAKTEPREKKFCPDGRREATHKPEKSTGEFENANNLAEELKGNKYFTFYQVCRALGCTRCDKLR